MITVEQARQALKEHGSKRQAAKALGVPKTTFLRFCMKNNLESPSDIKEARQKDAKIRELQTRLRMAELKLNQSESELDALKDLYEAADEAYRRYGEDEIALPIKTQAVDGKGSATVIICATDWHAEGRVDPGLVDGLNEFNLDVCDKRLSRLWSKAIYMSEFASNISNITDYLLWLGGDLMNGAIHEELEETNFLGPAEAILYAQDHIANGIDHLLQETNKPLLVATNQGNHGRTTKRKRISTGYRHSWEYLAYCNLQRIYKNNPRVRFKITRGYHNTVDVQGHRVRFSHGDAVKYYGGVGGITIPVKKKIANWNKSQRADLDIFGHFHQFLHHWDFVSIGCLCGYNEYAMELACEYQPPTQGIVVIDRDYGKVLAAPLYVEKAGGSHIYH